jgi:hypothetical protein
VGGSVVGDDVGAGDGGGEGSCSMSWPWVTNASPEL